MQVSGFFQTADGVELHYCVLCTYIRIEYLCVSEIDEETKIQRYHKTATTERAKSKISRTEFQQKEHFVDEALIKRAREKEEYNLRKRRAEELHAVKMATEKKLGELQVKEMELRVEHLKKKQNLELEILMLQKKKEIQALQLS